MEITGRLLGDYWETKWEITQAMKLFFIRSGRRLEKSPHNISLEKDIILSFDDILCECRWSTKDLLVA